MPCPVCSHTMHNLGLDTERKFWCPRCGTVKTERGDFEEHETPRWTRVAVANQMDQLESEVEEAAITEEYRK